MNDASCDVVLIWLMMLLYCDTRPARVACELASPTGAETITPANSSPAAVAVPPRVPIVEDAASLDVVMVIAPVEAILA